MYSREFLVFIFNLLQSIFFIGNGHNDVFEHNGAPFTSRSQTSKSHSRNNGSLRKTPLRNSIDSYNKLLEVHRHTIDKIAFEVSRLVCSCDLLYTTGWDDYERSDDVISLGLTRYMAVPVTCAKSDLKNYTAWVGFLLLYNLHQLKAV